MKYVGIKVCKFCGSEFEIYERNSSKICCNIRCANKFRRHYKLNRKCPKCGGFFTTNKNRKKFCSRHCSSTYRKSIIEKNCLVCSKSFLVTPGNITKKFCSINCKKRYFKSRIKIFKCLICNKEFERRPFQIKSGGGKFCSRSCSAKGSMRRFKAPSQKVMLDILDSIIREKGEREKTFSWFKSGKKNGHYFVDGYYKNLNLVVEYNGIQHYKFNSHFHRDQKDFNGNVVKDKKRMGILKENGLKVLIVRYDEPLTHFYLYKKLCDLGIKKWNEINGYVYNYIDAMTIDKFRLDDIVNMIKSVVLCKGRIFVCGNGGSYSTASHAGVDWLKVNNLDVTVLGSNSSVLTAFSNDEGYDVALSNQLERVANINDMLCCFSVSGTSPNIFKTIKTMKNIGGKVILFVGKLTKNNKWILKNVDNYLSVNSEDFGVVETIHQSYVHIICNELKGGDK